MFAQFRSHQTHVGLKKYTKVGRRLRDGTVTGIPDKENPSRSGAAWPIAVLDAGPPSMSARILCAWRTLIPADVTKSRVINETTNVGREWDANAGSPC